MGVRGGGGGGISSLQRFLVAPLCPHIKDLPRRLLLTNGAGRRFIRVYYRATSVFSFNQINQINGLLLPGQLVLINGESLALVGGKIASEAETCEQRDCADEKIEAVEAGESYNRCSKHGPQSHTREP
jgi:hypothetical protein